MDTARFMPPAWTDQATLSFGENGASCLDLDLARLVTYSRTRPWSLPAIAWHLDAVERQADRCAYRFSDGQANVTLHLAPFGEAVCLSVTLTNASADTWDDVTCALQLYLPDARPGKIVIPHVIYNDNPSADPERLVPRIGSQPGQGSVFEEHRLPIPAVSVAWGSPGEERFVTLLSRPEVTSGEDRDYWSLGALNQDQGLSVLALSGPVMLGGQKDMTYGAQCQAVPYDGAYRSLVPGESLSKTFFLQHGTGAGTGKGFRSMVRLAYDALKPEAVSRHSLAEMVAFKKNVLDHRFHENARSVGYICYGASNSFGDVSGRPEYYLYAWTGQALKLAWCDCVLGLGTAETFRLVRGIDAADFYVRYSGTATPGLRRAYYYHQSDSWGIPGDGRGYGAHGSRQIDGKTVEIISSRMLGEALADLVDIMLLLREHGKAVPAHWNEAVRASCAFLMDHQCQTADGIYPLYWHPDGSVGEQLVSAAGISCVTALVKAWSYFRDETFLSFAAQICSTYADLHIRTMDRPFARATLDARCEDKEAGIAFFLAAFELFKATGDEMYRTWAGLAADWILTFVYFWDTGFKPGSICARKQFRTTGWPGVSVQNHHLDVFFPVYELYEFGRLCRDDLYSQMAQKIRNALTQGVCTYRGEWGFSVIGEQGEQIYQTNYGQVGKAGSQQLFWRGGMHVWNPSWITAQVLQHTLRFQAEKLLKN